MYLLIINIFFDPTGTYIKCWKQNNGHRVKVKPSSRHSVLLSCIIRWSKEGLLVTIASACSCNILIMESASSTVKVYTFFSLLFKPTSQAMNHNCIHINYTNNQIHSSKWVLLMFFSAWITTGSGRNVRGASGVSAVSFVASCKTKTTVVDTVGLAPMPKLVWLRGRETEFSI